MVSPGFSVAFRVVTLLAGRINILPVTESTSRNCSYLLVLNLLKLIWQVIAGQLNGNRIISLIDHDHSKCSVLIMFKSSCQHIGCVSGCFDPNRTRTYIFKVILTCIEGRIWLVLRQLHVSKTPVCPQTDIPSPESAVNRPCR